VKVSFDDDPARALDDTRHWAALALSAEEKMSVEDPVEMERLASALPVERAARRWLVGSDPDAHVEQIRPYVELGFRHLVFTRPAQIRAVPAPVFAAGDAEAAVAVQLNPCAKPLRPASLQLLALPDFPLVQPGDDLVALIAAAVERSGMAPADGDVFVVAQKIVSKAENRIVDLASVVPSARAIAVAGVRKDARMVELILRNPAHRAQRPGLLIVEHRLGFVMANAGIDQSNVEHGEGGAGGERALLLPVDPDASAARLREQLRQRTGAEVGVVINDSFGRPWRDGAVGVAIGCAGVAAVRDQRGQTDLFGRTLRATVVGTADEIASAASMVMGQAAEGLPVVLLRGLPPQGPAKPVQERAPLGDVPRVHR
jgi:coenzyme F420-0:L-glutamate ligase/coenzyme F420-1:gamma-L-glutamate ligase